MSNNTDFLFLNLKQLYPNLCPPAKMDLEIWEEILAPFEQEDIYNALKDYRRSPKGNYAPGFAQFREFLELYRKKTPQEPDLPLSAETYLMDQDIKAGRCKHFFPTYVRAVEYVLNDKLKETIGEEKFKTYNRTQCYRAAVDLGLFADFDKTLDYVYKEKY